MPILNYTTKIESYKTITQIQQILSKKGASKMIIDNDPAGNPISLTFCLTWNGVLTGYCLPCNFKGVLQSMKKSNKVTRKLCTDEQALRVGWRIVKTWTESQLALVEAELATIQELFLPYALTKGGTTLYKMLESDNHLLLTN